jgi:hypothetical protein
MSKEILQIAGEVQKYINDGYNYMAPKMFNINSHRFEIKQEVIAKSGLWLRKKRYAQWIINEGGVPKDEMEVKGLDVVRSSFPKKFQSFMKEILKDILEETPKEDIDNKILKFEKHINQVPIEEICRNSSVKELSKFEERVGWAPLGKLPKIVEEGKTVTFPVHCKASINYNKLLVHLGLHEKYEPIIDMEKVLWCYVKRNKYGIEELAYKGYNDPPEITEFVENNIDKSKIFNKDLATKIYNNTKKDSIDFYQALKWTKPSIAGKNMKKFFKKKG